MPEEKTKPAPVKKRETGKPRIKNRTKADGTKIALFVWDETSTQAATMLAEGYTYKETSQATKIPERTLKYWRSASNEFAVQVDNLSLMIGVASKAERMRIAARIIRQKMRKKTPSRVDLLGWLYFAAHEQSGAQINIEGLDVIIKQYSENGAANPALPALDAGGVTGGAKTQGAGNNDKSS